MVIYVKNPKDSKIKILRLISLFSKGEGCEVASGDDYFWNLVVVVKDAYKCPTLNSTVPAIKNDLSGPKCQ